MRCIGVLASLGVLAVACGGPAAEAGRAERVAACERLFAASLAVGLGGERTLEIAELRLPDVLRLRCDEPVPADTAAVLEAAFVRRCTDFLALPGLAISGATIDACAVQLGQLPCGAPPPAACLDLPFGSRGDDESCAANEQCESTSCAGAPCGRCQRRSRDGEECSARGLYLPPCIHGSYCGTPRGRAGGAGVCMRGEPVATEPPAPPSPPAPRAGVGEPCASDAGCAIELHCDGSAVCRPRAPIGAKCYDAPCVAGAYCDSGGSVVAFDGTCKPVVPLGTRCPFDHDESCGEEATCEAVGAGGSYVCVSKNPRRAWPGQPCNGIDTRCTFGECTGEREGAAPSLCPAIVVPGAACTPRLTTCLYELSVCSSEGRCIEPRSCQ